MRKEVYPLFPKMIEMRYRAGPAPGGRFLLLAGAILLHLLVFWTVRNWIVFSAPPALENHSHFLQVTIPKAVPPPTAGGVSANAVPTPSAPRPVITTSMPNATFATSKVFLPQWNDGMVKGSAAGGLEHGLGSQMTGLLFELPCVSSGSCPLSSKSDIHIHLSDQLVHTCTLAVRGLVEQKTYRGGRPNGYLNDGGLPNPDNYSLYSISVDDPLQIYYLNAGDFGKNAVWVLNYAMTIQIKDNSHIVLDGESIDGKEAQNPHQVLVPDTIAAHPITVKQPYRGQFIQIDALDIK